MTTEFIDNRNRFFDDVKALGRKNSATLGVKKTKSGFTPSPDCKQQVTRKIQMKPLMSSGFTTFMLFTTDI